LNWEQVPQAAKLQAVRSAVRKADNAVAATTVLPPPPPPTPSQNNAARLCCSNKDQ